MGVIRVAVLGAGGRMGSEVCRALAEDPGLELVAAVDPAANGPPVSAMPEPAPAPSFETDLSALTENRAEVAVDFTTASSAVQNVLWCMENGVHCVVGTTGISAGDLQEIRRRSDGASANVLIAPNFAIGAVLMMRFAEIASGWLPAAEIIELHHDGKLDAPSGTAIKTAEAISRARRLAAGDPDVNTTDAAPAVAGPPDSAARGATREGIQIHSVRLPGLVAHQEVVFGARGQTLSIRHDSIDRTSFMPGVLLAVHRIKDLPGLTVGLESVLGI